MLVGGIWPLKSRDSFITKTQRKQTVDLRLTDEEIPYAETVGRRKWISGEICCETVGRSKWISREIDAAVINH